MNAAISLFKSADIWHFRFQVDGKRVQRSTHVTVRERAEKVAQDAYDAAILASRGEAPEPTLRELVGLWVRFHAPVVSAQHLRNVEAFGKLHMGELADLPLRELTTERVEDARNAYLATHARNSANLWLSTLRLLAGWAIRRKMLRQVPWQVPKLKIQRQPKLVMPTAASGPWLGTVDAMTQDDPGMAVVIRLMMGLGLRIGEAMEAQWPWLDLERKRYTPGKTKGREAWARPVPDWLVGQLATFRAPLGPIVPQIPGRRITDKRIRDLMAKANAAHGLTRITPHRLRGTYATLLSEAGTPIQDIRQAMGHKSILTTEGYLEVDMSRVAVAQTIIADRQKLPGRDFGAPDASKARQASIRKLSGESAEKGRR